MKQNVFALSIVITALLLAFIFGCSKEEEKSNKLPGCKIVAPANGQEIFKGDTVVISVNAIDSDGTIIGVRFFIDGVGKGSADIFPYNYAWATSSESIGNHTIKALSIDNSGGTNSDEITVEISLGGDFPVADFTASPGSGLQPLIVSFTDQSTNNPQSWEWNFGDGGSSTEHSPSYTYNDIGIYTVSLTVTNVYASDTEIKENYIIVSSGGGTGEPCPGTPTFNWQGRTYNTVLIGSQCWMKENLNYQTGNSWCYGDNAANCNTYGRLYDWETIMNGEASSNSVPSGVQGICPDGWHIPGDQEWKILEGIVDSQYGMGHNIWDNTGWRGFDAGKRLKTVSGWESGIGTNSFMFSALPGGVRSSEGTFSGKGFDGVWWSATEYDSTKVWLRSLYYDSDGVNRYNYPNKPSAYSLRCVRDY